MLKCCSTWNMVRLRHTLAPPLWNALGPWPDWLHHFLRPCYILYFTTILQLYTLVLLYSIIQERLCLNIRQLIDMFLLKSIKKHYSTIQNKKQSEVRAKCVCAKGLVCLYRKFDVTAISNQPPLIGLTHRVESCFLRNSNTVSVTKTFFSRVHFQK